MATAYIHFCGSEIYDPPFFLEIIHNFISSIILTDFAWIFVIRGVLVP